MLIVHIGCRSSGYMDDSHSITIKKVTRAKIGSAEEKAREIIDEALKVAETKKREALLEAKEESIEGEE